MSNDWFYFPCQMGDHRAFIFYDHGIRQTIDTDIPTFLLKVSVAFKNPTADGLPASEEFTALSAFEDALQSLITRHEGVYVGRVTVKGYRHFFNYVPDQGANWSSILDELGNKHSYEIALLLDLDEKHEGYWRELFPTEDDWQVILDLQVLDALAQKGDNASTARRIDHWAYFQTEETAQQFIEWTKQHDYVEQRTDLTKEGKLQVRFFHEGSVELADITSRTIAIRRKASELQGDYDGWEAPVCKQLAD